MNLTLLKSKIHRAVVTQAELNYVGSITVDRALMDAAGIVEYEKVLVVDIESGSRLETYVIEGEKGSGIICLNGAAARLVQTGDHVIIMSFCSMESSEVGNYQPIVVFVGEGNKIDQISKYERYGEIGRYGGVELKAVNKSLRLLQNHKGIDSLCGGGVSNAA